MGKFHLTHLIPDDRHHIFFGYKEIIETLSWGLSQLGHETTYGINRLVKGATNILFGAQMLPMEQLRQLPADSIIYNLEQIAGMTPEHGGEAIRYCAEHFRVWDFSAFNIPVWKGLHPDGSASHVPIGYAPILTRIQKAEPQDIEVLFYGGPGRDGSRLKVFHDLCNGLVKTVFVHGLYGESRDSLIARSMLVLNLNQYPQHGIFEVARVSYLLANRKAVVSDLKPFTKIEDDLKDCLAFADAESMVEVCADLIRDEGKRRELQERGYDTFAKRDIREILSRVLD